MSMQITVDPKELVDTAVLLGSSALELAEIGSTLRACTGCEMPPDVRGTIDAFVSTLDRVLDEMAAGLRSEAGGLAQRAVIAANDMLTAAGLPPLPGTVSTTPGVGGALIGGGQGGAVISGTGSSSMIIGGHDSGTITITNPDGTPYVSPSSMTIGGNNWGTITITNPDGTPYVSPSSVTIGGGVTSDPTGLLGLAQLQQKSHDRAQVIIDRLVRSGDPAAVSAGMAGQARQGDALSHVIAPSRSQLEDRAGHSLTWAEIARISPATVPFGLR